jgi:hypothetical protein
MEPEGSLPCSQEPDAGPYPEPDDSGKDNAIINLGNHEPNSCFNLRNHELDACAEHLRSFSYSDLRRRVQRSFNFSRIRLKYDLSTCVFVVRQQERNLCTFEGRCLWDRVYAVDAAGWRVTTAESRCNQYAPSGLTKVCELYRNLSLSFYSALFVTRFCASGSLVIGQQTCVGFIVSGAEMSRVSHWCCSCTTGTFSLTHHHRLRSTSIDGECYILHKLKLGGFVGNPKGETPFERTRRGREDNIKDEL